MPYVYDAEPTQSIDNPFGEGADHIHDWLFKPKGFREIHGDPHDGDTGTNDDIFREAFANVGANIMGRNMFGGGSGDWGTDPWQGW